MVALRSSSRLAISVDFEIRGADEKAVLRAMATLPKQYPGLAFERLNHETQSWSISVHSLAMGTVEVSRGDTVVSGRSHASPVLMWVADALCIASGKGIVWDPQEDTELEGAPTWEEVLEFVPEPTDEVEADALGIDNATDEAQHFLALLEENNKIEIDGDRQDLARTVALALETPEAKRAQAVETVFLTHPAVVELFADRDEIAELLSAWG